MKDFGVVGSEEIILVKCFGEGSINLIKGFVINPNTWKGQKQYVKNPSKCFGFGTMNAHLLVYVSLLHACQMYTES